MMKAGAKLILTAQIASLENIQKHWLLLAIQPVRYVHLDHIQAWMASLHAAFARQESTSTAQVQLPVCHALLETTPTRKDCKTAKGAQLEPTLTRIQPQPAAIVPRVHTSTGLGQPVPQHAWAVQQEHSL
jgi:hypothetical protein